MKGLLRTPYISKELERHGEEKDGLRRGLARPLAMATLGEVAEW